MNGSEHNNTKKGTKEKKKYRVCIRLKQTLEHLQLNSRERNLSFSFSNSCTYIYIFFASKEKF